MMIKKYELSSEIQMPQAYRSVINESISFLFRRPCKASGNRKNLDDSTREYDSCWNNCTYVVLYTCSEAHGFSQAICDAVRKELQIT